MRSQKLDVSATIPDQIGKNQLGIEPLGWKNCGA